MPHQSGFTLIELMVTIAIIAILSGIGIPAYQGYIQKAALVDMLQAIVPHKTAVEFCALEQPNLTGCSTGSNGIVTGEATRYVSAIQVTQGVITLTGQQSLAGLTVTLTPQKSSANGNISWARECESSNASLVESCNDVLRL